MSDPDRPCPHPETEVTVRVTHLEDSGKTQADIRISCAACGVPYLFPAEIPVGVDLRGVARSFDGSELRVAIYAENDARELTG